MEMLNTKGKINNEIWQIRKKYTGKQEAKLAVRNEDDEIITETEEIHKRYQEYYRKLLQNRPVHEEYVPHNEILNENHSMHTEDKSYDEY